jgi:hypothetical protein
MSVNEITSEETAKIAGILETKWVQTDADKMRFKAEADSLRTALDVMTADRDYWRHRAEEAEKERDDAREGEEYMHRQWQGVAAIATETMARRIERKAQKKLPPPKYDDTPPSVVVFNRRAENGSREDNVN